MVRMPEARFARLRMHFSRTLAFLPLWPTPTFLRGWLPLKKFFQIHLQSHPFDCRFAA
jgi:hypothetical protein